MIGRSFGVYLLDFAGVCVALQRFLGLFALHLTRHLCFVSHFEGEVLQRRPAWFAIEIYWFSAICSLSSGSSSAFAFSFLGLLLVVLISAFVEDRLFCY